MAYFKPITFPVTLPQQLLSFGYTSSIIIVLIGLQVRFHSAMKHENHVRNMVGCLQGVKIYIFIIMK